MRNATGEALRSGHVSIIGEGVRSVESVLSNVPDLASISAVCLHGNLLSTCADISQFVSLTDLNLSANQITSVRDLSGLPQLVNLNLSSNRLCNLDGFPPLPKLNRLGVAHNRLTCLSGLGSLEGGCLAAVDIRSNCLSDLCCLAIFASMPSLRSISISGGAASNPIAGMAGLQVAVAAALPQVSTCAFQPADGARGGHRKRKAPVCAGYEAGQSRPASTTWDTS